MHALLTCIAHEIVFSNSSYTMIDGDVNTVEVFASFFPVHQQKQKEARQSECGSRSNTTATAVAIVKVVV